MLIGFVSDERFLAVCGAELEFVTMYRSPVHLRSSPTGAVWGDLPPGRYGVAIHRDGMGPKIVEIDIATPDKHQPYHFRLLSDTLLGYVWPKWARAGERGEFRVHSVEPYRLSLHRYGKTREFIKLLGWFDEHAPRAVTQITPDGDYTQTGVEWNKRGYGSSHHTQFALAPQRSGLYYFHAQTESGRFFSFPWVVAPAKPAAPIAVLANTNTWNAYNNFGGRSNYFNSVGLPPTPTVNARTEHPRYVASCFNEWGAPDVHYTPLSFDRPEPANHIPLEATVDGPIRGRMACGLAEAEWRMLGWLEREGFDYDLYSDQQLHDGTLDLDAYRALVVGVHPEYWSRAMYERVKSWVFERGGRLAYLGGNGINCEVEFPSPDRMKCNTQLVAAPGSLAPRNPADPSKPFDSRFARKVESEASLLGVVTTETGIMTAAPYRVTDPSHWAFAGTGLREGDRFGLASQHERCHGGASGHETDKRSAHSPANARLLAKGENPDDGGAEIVYHEPPRGSAPRQPMVFSTGSINYVASLWVDPHVSRITSNVLRGFLAP